MCACPNKAGNFNSDMSFGVVDPPGPQAAGFVAGRTASVNAVEIEAGKSDYGR